ncbi:MAG: PaaI family thioesterase [Acetobacteraceae bacterium]
MARQEKGAPNDEPLERLRAVLAAPPFHAFLQPQAVAVDPEAGIVEVRLPFRPEFRRVSDKPEYHGGVIASLIDLVAHATAALRTGYMAPSVDLRIDYLHVAAETDLHARGTVQRFGRTLAVVDVEVKDGLGRKVALGRGLLSVAPSGVSFEA